MESRRSNGKNVFKSAVNHSKNVFKRAICIFPSYRRKFIRDVASKKSFPFSKMNVEIQLIEKTT